MANLHHFMDDDADGDGWTMTSRKLGVKQELGLTVMTMGYRRRRTFPRKNKPAPNEFDRSWIRQHLAHVSWTIRDGMTVRWKMTQTKSPDVTVMWTRTRVALTSRASA